jgi:hypothetical protein
MRTYLYKLTSDRGGAPCAINAPEPLLTLAICKPAIRRTAQAGDRILGITSHSLANREGYPLSSVIYAAVVGEGVEARDYFAAGGEFAARPDCIYEFHQANGRALHTGRSQLHAAEKHLLKDLGTYPFYRNGRILLCRDFRYFGAEAVRIPSRLHLLNAAAETLGQGHRVYREDEPESKEADALFRALWKLPTRFTPEQVEADAYDHAPCSPGAKARKRIRVPGC